MCEELDDLDDPEEVLVDGWIRLIEQVETLPAERWDHLVCLFAQGGSAILYPERCLRPWRRQEHPDEEVPQHFELHLIASHRVDLAIPQFSTDDWPPEEDDDFHDEGEDPLDEFVPVFDRDEALTELDASRVEALLGSLEEPSVLEALARLGGPEKVGVHWCDDHEGAWCVHHRHLWGRPLPPMEPARGALGALSPLYWRIHSDVGRRHVGLAFDEEDRLVEALLAGPEVTDSTLALLSPEAASVCGTLRTLTIEQSRASEEAVARVRGLLPNTEVIVRDTRTPFEDSPYMRAKRAAAPQATSLWRRLRGLFAGPRGDDS